MPGLGGILSIDASPRCGWAYGRFGERPIFGHWDLGPIDPEGPILCRMFDALHDAIKVYRPSQIVYEAPFAPQQQKNAKIGKVLLGLCTMIEFTACRYDILCSPAECSTARKQVLGFKPTGGPDKVKPIIVDWAARRGWQTRCHDEADALLLLQHATVVADRTGRAHYNRHGDVL